MEANTSIGEPSLQVTARNAFSWSLLNSVVRRLWGFALGIILARLLAPEVFGVYAIALATLVILTSMNELGVSLAIVRWQGDPARPARTATTIAIVTSFLMYALTFIAAPVVADYLNTPEATAVIRVLTIAVVIDGFSSIPNALLERAFLQNRRIVADVTGIVFNGVVAIGLALAGFGPLAIALGILAGNLVASALIIVLAPSRPLPGFKRDDARALLAVGLPLAGASLLVFVLLNVDYFVIASVVGAEFLGLYLLAFNVSSWSPNLFTVAIRSVSIPAFSRLAPSPERLHSRFAQIFGLLMTVAIPVAVLVGVLARRIIVVLYGSEWVPAASALAILATLGVARVGLDLCYDFFVAVGRSRTVLWLQALWVAALIPTMLVGTRMGGIEGAAVAHIVVVVTIMVPAFSYALHRAEMPLRPLAVALRRPAVVSFVTLATVLMVDSAMTTDLVALVAGGLAGILVYASLVLPWRQGRDAVTDVLGLARRSV